MPTQIEKTCDVCGATFQTNLPQKIRCSQQCSYQKSKERIRDWQKANPDKVRVSIKKWESQNSEKLNQAAKAWKEDNTKSIRQSQTKYRQRHAAIVKRRVARWQKANPDRLKAAFHRYQARKKSIPGSFTAEEWNQLKASHAHRCVSCGQQEPAIVLAADHIIPVSWGTDKGATNDITNIQPLCKQCNSSKGPHHATDYTKGKMK
jgi:5-methylcytosine-specific restriction endonuclease McrA